MNRKHFSDSVAEIFHDSVPAKPIHISILIPTSRDLVFAAFGQEDFLRAWLGPMNGEVRDFVLTPRIGRPFSFELVKGEWKNKVEGKILDLVPGERVSFSYGSRSHLGAETRVDLQLKVAYGGTQLILTENGHLREHDLRRKRKLWKYMLRNLARKFESSF